MQSVMGSSPSCPGHLSPHHVQGVTVRLRALPGPLLDATEFEDLSPVCWDLRRDRVTSGRCRRDRYPMPRASESDRWSPGDPHPHHAPIIVGPPRVFFLSMPETV